MKVMPYVVRAREPVRAPPSGDVAAGFWCDCLPFAFMATLTVAVTTLDVITDWLLYRAFQVVGFTERLQGALAQPGFNESQPMVWRNRRVYLHLPLLLQVFCFLGAVVYVLDLLWMSWMFTIERRKFKDKRDGLPHKSSVLEKHGSDVFILLHASLHQLPVSALLLAAQLAVSCQLVLHLGHIIFYIAMTTTLASVVWKLLQVVFNSGCFGQGKEFHCTPGSSVVRAGSVVLLLGALAAAALNVVLLNGWRGSGSNSDKPSTVFSEQMLDKIRIDSWLRDDGVFLAVDLSQTNLAGAVQGPTDGSAANNNRTFSPAIVKLAVMTRLFAEPQQTLIVDLPCEGAGYYLAFVLWMDSTGIGMKNCSVVFTLKVLPPEGILYYDFYIRYVTPDGVCTHLRKHNMTPYTSSAYPAGVSPTLPSHLVEDKKDSNSVSNPSVPAGSSSSQVGASTRFPPVDRLITQGTVISPEDVSMAIQISENVRMFISRSSQLKCTYSIVRNKSLSPDNPCNAVSS